MFSRFFINRPIFASVLSIVITLIGGIALTTLPITQYPEITPPTVEVSASYPGANCEEVVKTVGAPIEQQVNGVENMLYMSSQATNDGTYILTITFKVGTDLNMAQVLVQNRVSLAQPQLPNDVAREGITVKKKSPSQLMIVNLYSPDGTRDALYLSNYATIQLRDELARLQGVGDIGYIGQRDYSMRVWLDPTKLAARGLGADDVRTAIEQQNVQVPAGQIGQPPVPTGQEMQFTITTLGRLTSVKQFENIIVKAKTGADAVGQLVRLKDVGRVELGSVTYNQTCTLNGQPSVALSVYQLPGSNALQTARTVRAKMDELKARFPTGVDYAIVYDTTPSIVESISEVFNTLRDAVLLVAFVVLLFLQNWRSAIIPLVAVPVAIVGTFAIMAGFGFSLNNLTLFGLVLAIGIVVDDAIVVVEAVEHHIEHGMAPREATVQAMREVSGPVVAVGLVLTAVFVPAAFITGITGLFFRQFALTIAVSTVISAFNSLTLSPALCAILLRPREHHKANEVLPRHGIAAVVGATLAWFVGPTLWESLAASANVSSYVGGPGIGLFLLRWLIVLPVGYGVGLLVAGPINFVLGTAFRWFNVGFNAVTAGYTRLVSGLLRVSLIALLVYGGLLFLTYESFEYTPTGFIPAQDRGYLLVNVQLPDAHSQEETQAVMQKIEAMAREFDGVKHTVGIAGQSVLLNASAANFGSMYVMLDDFHHRTRPGLSADEIGHRLQAAFEEKIGEAMVSVFGAPPVEGLGTVGGFKLVIEDRGDNGKDTIQAVADSVVSRGSFHDGLMGLFTSYRADTPWLYLDIDRTKAKMLGVSIQQIIDTLQIQFGSYYVNDINLFDRTWKVMVQAGDRFRMSSQDIKLVQVPNDKGGMVPLGTILATRPSSGPTMIVRYNMYPSAFVNGNAAPGTSSGQAIEHMQDVARQELPRSMKYEWTELAMLQLDTGNTAMLAFLLAVVLVFLVLAAQYESWSLPLAVILVVPMCLLCSIAGVLIARMDINIFTQIGFIVLVGLASKNAILIVEFAKLKRDSGVDRRTATLAACKLRLRPILMTSFAFILGVVPLMVSVGAGAEMRRTLGVAVFAGMLGVTLFGIFLTPVFYFVIQWYNDRRLERKAQRTKDQPHVYPSTNGHYLVPAWASAAPVPVHANGDGNGDGHANGDGHVNGDSHAKHAVKEGEAH